MNHSLNTKGVIGYRAAYFSKALVWGAYLIGTDIT